MIVFTGLAGSGKSVQGLLLSKTLNYEWISVGDLLREKLTGENRQRMLDGEVVKDEVTLGLLKPKIESITTDRLILDGFPRTIIQTDWVLDLHNQGKLNVECIIHLQISKDAALARLLKRGRLDDKSEIIVKRFSKMHDDVIIPILDRFKKAGVPVYEINGDQTIQEVQEDIMESIKS